MVISIKQINAILFLFSFKKNASKLEELVMLSYFLLFNKRLDIWLLFNSVQNSHVHETSKLVENLQYYHREKPNLKSSSWIKKA